MGAIRTPAPLLLGRLSPKRKRKGTQGTPPASGSYCSPTMQGGDRGLGWEQAVLGGLPGIAATSTPHAQEAWMVCPHTERPPRHCPPKQTTGGGGSVQHPRHRVDSLGQLACSPESLNRCSREFGMPIPGGGVGGPCNPERESGHHTETPGTLRKLVGTQRDP